MKNSYVITAKISAFAMAFASLIACSAESPSDSSQLLGARWGNQTGAGLTIDFIGGTDVTGFQFFTRACGEEEWALALESDLEDVVLPGGNPGLEDAPLDEASIHIFADAFIQLEAGCYDLRAIPVNDTSSPSETCHASETEDIEVIPGRTTEVLMVSQCSTPNLGGLGGTVAVNHDPVMQISYETAKFVFECERTVMCAEAEDVNGDSMVFVWRQRFGEELAQPVVIEHHEEPGFIRECVEIVSPMAGSFVFRVSAYDLTGEGRPFESIAEGDSHATIEFPIHVSQDLTFACYDSDSSTYEHHEGVRDIDRAPGCAWTTPADFYCDAANPDRDTQCPDDTFEPLSVYPECED